MRGGMIVVAGALVLGAAGLSGCGKGSAEPARVHADTGGSGTASAGEVSGEGSGSGGSGYGQVAYKKREPVPSFHGEPMWSDNRKHSSAENAHYHCDKSGADIGAKSFDDCLTKVHAFIDHPPAGAKTMTRSNGDKLIYDPKANMFAVARKDGAPRTFFKPRTGAEYWKEQQAEADSPRGYGSGRSYGGGSSRGSGGGGE